MGATGVTPGCGFDPYSDGIGRSGLGEVLI